MDNSRRFTGGGGGGASDDGDMNSRSVRSYGVSCFLVDERRCDSFDLLLEDEVDARERRSSFSLREDDDCAGRRCSGESSSLRCADLRKMGDGSRGGGGDGDDLRRVKSMSQLSEDDEPLRRRRGGVLERERDRDLRRRDENSSRCNSFWLRSSSSGTRMSLDCEVRKLSRGLSRDDEEFMGAAVEHTEGASPLSRACNMLSTRLSSRPEPMLIVLGAAAMTNKNSSACDGCLVSRRRSSSDMT